ncbi:MAG: extracellular solute-binding protein [Clostridiales bacterium]|nr:extracellular solute-binding protein [Clostridiales bacterium]
MKHFKRVTALALAAFCLLPLLIMTGCGKSKAQKTILTNVYNYEKVSFPDSVQQNGVNSVFYSGDRIYYSYYGMKENGEYSMLLESMNMDGSDIKSIPLKTNENTENSGSYISTFTVDSNGGVWYVEQMWSSDESTGEYTSQMVIHNINPDGTEIASFDFSDSTDYYADYLLATKTGDIYFSAGPKVFSIIDGKLDSSNDLGLEYINRIVADKSGNLYVAYYASEGEQYKIFLKKYDPKTKTLGENANIPESAKTNIYNLTSGFEYDFYYNTNTALFGCNIGDTEATELCNWLNSDFDAEYVNSYQVLDDGRLFVFAVPQTNEYTPSVYLMTKRPDSENVEKYMLTLGCLYMDTALRTAIVDFNRKNEEYRITVKDYSQYNTENDYNAASTKMNSDIVSGNTPDIIVLSSNMPYASYVSKGVFVDLNKYFDSDESLKREDYFENVFESTSYDGHLYSIIPSFSVLTLAVKESIVKEALGTSDISGINMEDFNKILATRPDATAFSDSTRDSFVSMLIYYTLNQFIDKETGKCSFDSQDFIDLLKFAETLPTKSIYDDIDWETVDDSFWTDMQLRYRNEESIFGPTYIYEIRDYWRVKAGDFGGDMILIGYPCEGKNGASFQSNLEFALSSSSKFIDAGWNFIKYFLSDEYQDSVQWMLPIKRSSFNKLADKAMTPPTSTSSASTSSGEEVVEQVAVDYYDDTSYYVGNEQIDIGRITQKEVDYLTSYISKVNVYSRPDETINKIMTEETSVFFAGTKTAEECAQLIQSRVQTYVSEQR